MRSSDTDIETDPNLRQQLVRLGIEPLLPQPASAASIAIVAASFHRGIVDRLLAGALQTLDDHGITASSIRVVRVAGAWELPLAAALAIDGGADAVVALGCVIRGETEHFEVIVREANRGLMEVMLARRVPVANGVLACHDHAQAYARAGFGDDAENKGVEAARAALALAGIAAALSAVRG